MVLPTFEHLPLEKQQRIKTALLTEFSQYPVADAQVARIVVNAQIARGAFYKYFRDLKDAYRYIFDVAMQEIHTQLPIAKSDSEDRYYQATRDFLYGVVDSEYQNLIKLHYQFNEGLIGSARLPEQGDAISWAVGTLCHQTIRMGILHPDQMDDGLQQLKIALDKLEA